MYIYGGRNREGLDLGDLGVLKILSRHWYTFQNMGAAPPPRLDHSMLVSGTDIVVLGGECIKGVEKLDFENYSSSHMLRTHKIKFPKAD